MKFLKDLLSEKSELSTTRAVQLLGIFMAFILAIIGMEKSVDLTALSVLCLSFIIPQTVAKVMQKKIE